MRGLNSKTLEAGFKFKLENGLDATAYTMASQKVRSLINRQFEKKQWPNLPKSLSDFLVVEVSGENEKIYLIYYARTNARKRAIVQTFHTNLHSINGLTYYAIYKERLFFSYERAMQAIVTAVIKKVTPEVAIIFYPKVWKRDKPLDKGSECYV